MLVMKTLALIAVVLGFSSVASAQTKLEAKDAPAPLVAAASDVIGAPRQELPRGSLKGKYAYSGEGSCTLSPSGFDPVSLAPLGFSFVSSFSVIGIWNFLADGTSVLTGRVVTTNHSPSQPSTTFVPAAAAVDVGAKFNVRVFNDGTFHQEVIPGSLFGNYLTGARRGQRFTVDKGTLTGFVLSNNTALTMATPDTEIEIQTIYDAAGNVLASVPRICHASRTLTQLKK
jgi:hypothetical protein